MLSENAFHAGSLCVVGNINRDIKTAPLQAQHKLFEDGETSLGWIVETVGGGGANSAFAAAALGGRVSLLAKIGADGLGHRLEQTLLKHGISAYLTRDRAHPTGSSLALSFTNGHRHFLSCLPASRSLSLADLNLCGLQHCRHLLRADIWFSEPMLFGGNARLFDQAKKLGVAISVDLNWDPAWGNADAKTIKTRKSAVRDVLASVDLAHGNTRELCEFADASTLEQALERITGWGAKAVVVHLGSKGAGFYQHGNLVIEPPLPAKVQVTNTGCGDVLSVCMILLHQDNSSSIRDRLRLANKVVSEFMEGKRRLLPELAE